mmetsp:Transcript_12115/g.10737  ORF Transcript_12115/g.10737 Transcript_12115/m.10737 type:complete len:204 (-) Transcript_12115:116-727(-)
MFESKKLDGEENYFYKGIPNFIDKKPEEFRFSMYESCRENEGVSGSERIKLLKKGFRTIIENALPLQYKLYQALFTYVGLPRTVKLMKDKRRNMSSNRKAYKFYKASKDYEGNEEDDSKETKFRIKLEENIYKYTFSTTLINRWQTVGEETQQYLVSLKEYLHDLVNLRNKIFRLLFKIQEHFYTSNVYSGYTKNDMKQLLSF